MVAVGLISGFAMTLAYINVGRNLFGNGLTLSGKTCNSLERKQLKRVFSELLVRML